MPIDPAPEQTLTIRYIPGSDPISFQVVRPRDGKAAPPVPVTPPSLFPVEDRPNSNLLRELQWYLETFLDYPFPPETDHAERVLKALRDWGEEAFQKLFTDTIARRIFDDATKEYSKLHVEISSDDPRVLAWPWEALRDPEADFIGRSCQVVRRMNTVRDPQNLSELLPKDRLNILLVVARPFGNEDVGFRSIARPLVELIEREKLSARVEMLRPPTFDQLRSHLREHPGFYHILHFDGHGAYSVSSSGGGFTFQAQEGKLIFETEDGEPDPITAEKLSGLLKEYAVPGVVLNACQSAMTATDSNDPFASVAMALLKSGMRDVVAMAYSLYVSGAQQFLPAFYKRLFEEGSMAVAVKAGRQQMWQHDKRVCVRGEFPLHDWLLPVLYQQDPLDFAFAKESGEVATHESKLPEELRREKNPYGFIGRDSAILELERAMRRGPAGILIQGLGGIGKTTLARGLLQWLDQTGGLEYPPFWLSFQEIRSAEFVFNRMGEALFGGNFPTLPIDKKIEALSALLRENGFVIVWDNFESASGIAGTAIDANLPESDRNLLARFLDELRGGKTKVIITSRSQEEWLSSHRRFLLPLGGLDREERWEYCNAILRDLGKKIDRNDKDLAELMNLLGGHPLAMRAILPRLEKMSAGQVLVALRSNLASLQSEEDEEQAKLYATLAFVEQSLPEELHPLLILVGMHEGFADADYMEAMAKQVDAAWSREKIDALMHALVSAGLLRDIGQAAYAMHPLLTSYLRSSQSRKATLDDVKRWAQAFVVVIASVASHFGSKELHEQRVPFHLHGQNFYHALADADRLGISTYSLALVQALAMFALNNRNFDAAQRLYERYAALSKSSGDPVGEATAYHQLGLIAQEQRNFTSAEQWYRKSLAIEQELANKEGIAKGYHQLGRIAEIQRDFSAAEEWYLKVLAVEQAEEVLAKTYHQLGTLSREQRKFEAAEQWYLKSLAIEQKLGNEYESAKTYHQLGILAYLQDNFLEAKKWYLQSLAIDEKLGDEEGKGQTFHQLGMVAQHEGDYFAADQWYRRSLAIDEKLGNEHSAAISYGVLGILAAQQGNVLDGGRWLMKSMLALLHSQDKQLARQIVNCFLKVYDAASARDQNKLRDMWEEAGLGEFPKDDPESE